MAEFLTTHVVPVQMVCLAIAAAILGPLLLSRSVRACVWASTRAKMLHGELCDCLYCEHLAELHQRISQLEQEVAILSASRNPALDTQSTAACSVSCR
jgi:hypothetical protein